MTDKEKKTHITVLFNEGLRCLIFEAHGVMPPDAIVMNVIASLCVARKQHGFTVEQTRDEIVAAVNQNMTWAIEIGKMAHEIDEFGRKNTV